MKQMQEMQAKTTTFTYRGIKKTNFFLKSFLGA